MKIEKLTKEQLTELKEKNETILCEYKVLRNTENGYLITMGNYALAQGKTIQSCIDDYNSNNIRTILVLNDLVNNFKEREKNEIISNEMETFNKTIN